MEKGDLVNYFNEKGIICYDNPLIMKTVDFHSYVPIQNEEKCILITKHFEIGCTIREAVVDRIKRYLEKSYVQQTGE